MKKECVSKDTANIPAEKHASFKKLLLEAGSPNINLADDVCGGFDLTGSFPRQTISARNRSRPVCLPFSLGSIGDWARQTLLASVRSSGNADIDRGVLQARLKEKEPTVFAGAYSSHKRSSRSRSHPEVRRNPTG